MNNIRILKVKFSLGIIFFLICTRAYTQESNWGIRFSSYGLYKGGVAFSLGVGYWKRFNYIQPSANMSVNVLCGRNHLGNSTKNNLSTQINIVLSPMLTFGWGKGFREEINTLYMSTASAVSSDYKTSFTLGSSFVTTPKGFGKNYLTSRNRSQQLAFFQLKIGIDGKKDNRKDSISLDKTIIFPNFKDDISVQFNVVEDVGPEFLADKWDRYYTGGGSIQVRMKERFKAKVFSEVYTGTTPRDFMDFPDIAEDSTGFGKRHKNRRFIIKNQRGLGPIRNNRWAIQDASQKMFNNGITAFALEIDKHYGEKLPAKLEFGDFIMAHNIYLFKHGGDDMWQQNIIHSMSSPEIEKVLEDRNPNELKYKRFWKDCKPFMSKKDLERLHFFRPNYNKSSGWKPGYGTSLYFN